MRRPIQSIIAALMALCLLCGCLPQEGPYVPTGDGLAGDSSRPSSAPSQTEQQMKLAYYPEAGFHPYQVAGYTNRTLFPLLYQGLFSVDRNYAVHPILCQRYTRSKDMKTYVFYPEKATFSDGTELTAQDVADSLQAAKLSPVYSGRLHAVQEITVTEDGGVSVKMRIPYEDLPILLDIPILKSADLESDMPLGTGAYAISESLDGLGLMRRSDWWCESQDLQVSASFIPLVSVRSNAEIRDAFEFEGVGLTTTDPGSYDYVDYRTDYEVWEAENGIFLYLACNEKSDVFGIPAVRQALTHAIDRKLLVDKCYRGFAVEATLPASPSSPYYNDVLAAKYAYAPDLFTQALESAGIEAGRKISLLVNKEDTTRVRAGRQIAKMLESYGFTVEFKDLAGDDYLASLLWDYYDLHLGQTMLSPNMDLTAFYSPTGVLNYGGLSDAAILARCQDSMANIGNYYTLHKAVMEDALLCPVLFRSYAIYGNRGLLSQIQPARDNAFFYTIGKTMLDVQ